MSRRIIGHSHRHTHFTQYTGHSAECSDRDAPTTRRATMRCSTTATRHKMPTHGRSNALPPTTTHASVKKHTQSQATRAICDITTVGGQEHSHGGARNMPSPPPRHTTRDPMVQARASVYFALCLIFLRLRCSRLVLFFFHFHLMRAFAFL